jgi:hypothetical protein
MTTNASGPAEYRGAADETLTEPVAVGAIVPQVADSLLRRHLAGWVDRLVDDAYAAGGAPPAYASDEWRALDERTDPTGLRRLASLAVAAELWRQYRDERVLDDLLELRDTHLAAYDAECAEFVEVAERIRRSANSPDFAELQRRRELS